MAGLGVRQFSNKGSNGFRVLGRMYYSTRSPLSGGKKMRRIVSLVLLSVFILAGVLPLYGSSPTTIVLTIGSTQASVNGEVVSFDVAPFIKDGRTFVPLRFVSEQLGAKVSYTIKSDGTVDRVTIKMGENLPPTPTSSPTPTPTPSSTPTSTPGWNVNDRLNGATDIRRNGASEGG